MCWSRCWPRTASDRYLSYDEFLLALSSARSQLLIQQSTQTSAGKGGKSKTSWWRR